MKTTIQKRTKIILLVLACSSLFFNACKQKETPPKPDDATLTKEITESEGKLFSLLKAGKVDEAFAMHSNAASYKNIADGNCRNHTEMDAALKDRTSKGIKAYDYTVAKRDFLIIDAVNVLETVEGSRKIVTVKDSITEDKNITLSILWTKDNSNWKVAYLNGSYKVGM